jgi:hypothetical protein
MYNGINISVGPLLSSWDEADEMKIPCVIRNYNSRCENLDFSYGSMIIKIRYGKESVRYVAEFFT